MKIEDRYKKALKLITEYENCPMEKDDSLDLDCQNRCSIHTSKESCWDLYIRKKFQKNEAEEVIRKIKKGE